MRGIFAAFKGFLITVLAVGCMLFVYFIANSPYFEKGERYEFYFGSSSDEIVLSRSPLDKVFLRGVSGESVRYQGDRAEELIQKYGAKILFTEESAGTVNYYCYSPAFGRSVELCGQKVNFHVAKNNTETAAGTPLIFGGF